MFVFFFYHKIYFFSYFFKILFIFLISVLYMLSYFNKWIIACSYTIDVVLWLSKNDFTSCQSWALLTEAAEQLISTFLNSWYPHFSKREVEPLFTKYLMKFLGNLWVVRQNKGAKTFKQETWDSGNWLLINVNIVVYG